MIDRDWLSLAIVFVVGAAGLAIAMSMAVSP